MIAMATVYSAFLALCETTRVSSNHEAGHVRKRNIDARSVPSLGELAVRFAAGKLGMGYVPLYEARLEARRHEHLTLLEIGVGGYAEPTQGGGSLRMWAQYLPNARIIGLDFFEKELELDPSVVLVKGSQDDPVVLDGLLAEYGPFDVVIDDGSHVNPQRNATFRHLFPHLRDGGFYVLEDLNTSYLRSYAGRATELDSPKTTMGMLKTLLDALNHAYIPGREPTPLDECIAGICTYPAIAFVSKDENRPQVSWNNQVEIDRELDALHEERNPS
jgi:hypothetical protein